MSNFQNNSEAAGKPPRRQQPHDQEFVLETLKNLKSRRRDSGVQRFVNMLNSNFWVLAAMTLGLTALIIGWWAVSGQGPGGTRLSGQAPETLQQTDTVATQPVESLEDRLTGLVDRMELLTDSITYLESKLIRAHVLTDSILAAEQHAASLASRQPVTSGTVRIVDKLPSTAAGLPSRQAPAERSATPQSTTVSTTAGVTGGGSTPRQTDAVSHAPPAVHRDAMTVQQMKTTEINQDAAHTSATPKTEAPVDKQPAPASEPANGLWLVNLTSSPSKAAADRFASQARSRGIDTRQQQVTIKGKHYWRVQAGGFTTRAEAQSYAGTLREKLGLKEVWLMRR